MSNELQVLEPNDRILHKGQVIPFTREHRRLAPDRLKPKVEQAIRMYAAGQLPSQEAAAAVAKIHPNRFATILNSPAGQAVVTNVRSQLEFQYQGLFKKFINVVSDGLDHPDPSVALAAASLYGRTQIGTKVKVELSAEDIIRAIMDGTYQE